VAGQLIVSISGIGGRTLGDIESFRSELDARGVPVSLLVAPRLNGGYRLDRDAVTVDWLTARRCHGDAVVLHGFDEAATKKRRGGMVRLAVGGKHLRRPGPRQAVLDAVDLALMYQCAPTVYRWQPYPALTDAA
jgi:predicted deacetylase